MSDNILFGCSTNLNDYIHVLRGLGKPEKHAEKAVRWCHSKGSFWGDENVKLGEEGDMMGQLSANAEP